jgi:hypothetical protein
MESVVFYSSGLFSPSERKSDVCLIGGCVFSRVSLDFGKENAVFSQPRIELPFNVDLHFILFMFSYIY